MLDQLNVLVDLVKGIHDTLDLPGRLHDLAVACTPILTGTLVNLVSTTADPSGRPLTSAAAISYFHPAVLAVANAGLTAVGVWSGYRMMWAHGLRNRHTLRILLPRLLLAVVLVNFSLVLLQWTVDASNTATEVIGSDSVRLVVAAVVGDITSGAGLDWLSFFTTGALLVGYLVLALGYVLRYALLVILAIMAPLAAVCFVLQETEHYAREWGSLYLATLLMQPMQLLVLAIGFRLDAPGGSPVRHLYALAALLIAFKVPGALHSVSSAGSRASSFAERQAAHLLHLAARA